HLEVITERESPLFFYTKIPFAVSEKDQVAQQAAKVDQFEMQIRAKKEALALIGALSQEQVSWVSGDGEINLKAQGELRFDKEISLADFEAKGNISLKEVVLRSPNLPQPVTLSGEIILDNKILKVENLEGLFAQGKLSLTGNLPLFLSLGELDDPLTLRINKTKIDLPNLYEGEAEGIMIVKGTAFSPKITGGIRLANGQIFVPESPEVSEKESSPLKVINWFKPRRNQTLLNPELTNFKITLDNLFVQQTPLYDFAFGGELMINGSLANWNQLKPSGQILLNRGRVSFLDTRFLLDRRYRNEISFVPTQGILNPNLDIKMRTIVSELAQSKRLRSSESNEIPDDSLNRVQRIDINLAVAGPLTQLLPNLNQAQIDSCNREKQFRPLRGTAQL
ncbi:MAG: translocation/assembly module TamB domain-containing protein, partial [Microcystaceae cyanobacterium]